ncbi:hypothetical protein M0802_011054 [Mischocyttarus mexicanus]|nr:hypothetical protein M0802_011054 [Mischocyttarus mexicanus]
MRITQLNVTLQSMLPTTIDFPQHKRVLQMKDNWEDDSSLSVIYRTYKANENCVKLRKIKMGQLNIPMKLSEYFWQQCYLSLIFVAIVITMYVIDYEWMLLPKSNYWQSIVWFIFGRYPSMVLLITDSTFIYWTSYIKRKFNQLNVLLKSMLTTSIDSPQHKRVFRITNKINNSDPSLSGIYRKYKSNEEVNRIKKIREIHLELIKCAKTLNDAYGLQILISISINFLLITTTSYSFYYFVISRNLHVANLHLFTFLFWIIYLWLKIILKSNICERTVAEIYDFTQQLIQNPLSFTSCGFFNLNDTLIRSAVSTVTTYLVILIQVGNIPLQVSVENSTLSTIDYISFCNFVNKSDMLFYSEIGKMSKMMINYQVFNIFFSYVVAIVAGLTRKKWHKLFLKHFETCMQEIEELNIAKKNTFLLWYQYIASVLLIIMIAGFTGVHIVWFGFSKLDQSLIIEFYFINHYPLIVTIVVDFTFFFWIKYIKMRITQLNVILQSMLPTTIDFPQHKRVLQMKDNWEDDSSLSVIYRTYRANENYVKLRKIKMVQLNIPMKLSEYFWQQCYLCLIIVAIVITMFVIDYGWMSITRYNWLAAIVNSFYGRYPNVMVLIVDSTFMFWTNYIKTKFNQLNVLLKSMLTTSIDSPQHKRVFRITNKINNSDPSLSGIYRKYKSNEEVNRIKKIREIHLELTKCAKIMNDAYSFHMLMSISVNFIVLISTGYTCYYYVITTNFHLSKLHLFTFVSWILFLCLKIILACRVCELTVTEIRDFIQQLIQYRLSFTACGFFNLDYTLLSNIIGTIVTYVIILIQLGKVTPVKDSSPNSTLASNNY